MKRVSKVVGALAALGFVMGIGVSAPVHSGASQTSVTMHPADTGWD